MTATDPVPLLQAKSLSCVRDQRQLFEQLDLSLAAGHALQIEGVNGAGKTSLLRLLCGLLTPQAGQIFWRGVDIRRCRYDFHAALLYLGHNPGLKRDLTPLENLRYYQATDGVEGDPEQALDAVGLYGFEEVIVRTLSSGQRRRVALARLWLGDHDLWLLDEPLTALDTAAVDRLAARLAWQVERGGSVLFTSHQPLEVPALERIELG